MLPSMERGLLGRRPLLVTRDVALIDSVQRLAAVAGVDLQIDAEGRGSWSSAPLILIGSDVLPVLVSMHLTRRSGVIVIGVGAPLPSSSAGQVAGSTPATSSTVTQEQMWRDAVAVGAEHVIVLPEAESWLVQRLGEASDGPSREGQLTVLLSASGGVGVSTLAVALAVAAQESHQRTLVIDGDPSGGGLDLLMGAEAVPGIRWPDLSEARGRLSAQTLDHALPHPNGVALLSHARPSGVRVDDDIAQSVVDAGLRGYDRVFVDLDADDSPLAHAARERASEILIVVPGSIRGIAAGLACIDGLRHLPCALIPVVRALPKGVSPRDVEQALGRHDIITVPDSPAVLSRANQGDGALPNDAFGKAVRSLLWTIQPTLARAV